MFGLKRNYEDGQNNNLNISNEWSLISTDQTNGSTITVQDISKYDEFLIILVSNGLPVSSTIIPKELFVSGKLCVTKYAGTNAEVGYTYISDTSLTTYNTNSSASTTVSKLYGRTASIVEGSGQNKNLQWYIDNGFLPNPNDICDDISVYDNRCQILKNGCYVKNGICYIDLMILSNIDSNTNDLNTTQSHTLLTGFPQRRDSGMYTLSSDSGTFGLEGSSIYTSKCSNGSPYQITGWYFISN